MASKPVQISIDERLLRVVDRHPKTKKDGRSAFIREAIEAYLRESRSRAIDESFRRAYPDKKAAREAYEEIKDLIAAQAWPED